MLHRLGADEQHFVYGPGPGTRDPMGGDGDSVTTLQIGGCAVDAVGDDVETEFRGRAADDPGPLLARTCIFPEHLRVLQTPQRMGKTIPRNS
jgi:hypothetical protein